jgi:hypothetical protein
LTIANFRLPIADLKNAPIGNRKSKIGNDKGPAPNNAEPQNFSPSCLADYFTWPQVALTHHVNYQSVLKHISATTVNTTHARVLVQFENTPNALFQIEPVPTLV